MKTVKCEIVTSLVNISVWLHVTEMSLCASISCTILFKGVKIKESAIVFIYCTVFLLFPHVSQYYVCVCAAETEVKIRRKVVMGIYFS